MPESNRPLKVFLCHAHSDKDAVKVLYCRRGGGGRLGKMLKVKDIEHYQYVVVSLKETMCLMGEVGEVIEVHGGWPVE